MEKKKVLIIAANDMGNSGVPNVYMQIIRNLHDEYAFDILITREGYFYRNEFLSYGGSIYLIKEKIYKNKLKRIWWRLIGLPTQTKKELKRIFINTKYDIIHSFKESDSWIYFKEAKKYGINKRIIHNNRIKEKGDSLFSSLHIFLSLKKSIRLSTDKISVSKVSGISFFKNRHFEIIYNTFNEKEYYFTNNKNLGNSLTLLQIGTFLPLKNQLFSLDIISILVDEYPDLKAVFIGKIYDKKYYKLFIEKIDELHLSERIKIFDGDTNQKEILQQVTFTLMPSSTEGFSITAVESQACGIRVFASNGVPSEVDLGNITFLPLNANKWASEISESFRKHRNQRNKVDTTKFSRSAFKEKIATVYKN